MTTFGDELDYNESSVYSYVNPTEAPETPQLYILLPYGIITGLGALGNTFFCLVVFTDRRLSSQRTNILLILMAMGNIAYLISIYVIEYIRRVRPHVVLSKTECELQNAVPAFSSAVCVFSLTACSIERYLGVVKFPLSAGSQKPWVFTVSATIVCLIMAFGIGALTWYWAELVFGYYCFPANFFLLTSGYKWSQLAHFFITYLFPFVTVSFCYASIITRIIQSSSRHRSQPGVRRSVATRKKGIIVLIAITLSFAILWLPYHVKQLMQAFNYLHFVNKPYAETIDQIAMYSGVANSVIDPGLIFMLSSDHRRAVVEHFAKLFCVRNTRNGHVRLSTVRSTMCTPSGTLVVKKTMNGTTAV